MANKEGMIKYNLVDTRGGVGEKVDLEYISENTIKNVRRFHNSFKEYSVTPLCRLDQLAKKLGLGEIYLKDESKRFDLNAFKVLGGAYAIGKYLADRLNVDINQVSFDYFRREDVKEKLGEITFVTATDGNHGRGVAWAANQLGQKSVVYMPRGSSQIRLDNIIREGSDASIIDGNYEDAVKLSDKMAQEKGWVVVQDTAWEGYEKIPTWIMQGYGTIMDEVIEQLEGVRPSHVFLQAGVGSFAGTMLGYLASKYGEERPFTLVVEPDDANCLYKSSIAKERIIVEGDMPTIMAGLACGAPNTVSYEVLKDYADGYLSCPDYVAARGMRIAAAPLGSDPKVVSGESGAVGLGALSLIAEREEYRELKEKIGLDENSVVLLISTEGDTDPQKYMDVVWDGDNSSI